MIVCVCVYHYILYIICIAIYSPACKSVNDVTLHSYCIGIFKGFTVSLLRVQNLILKKKQLMA